MPRSWTATTRAVAVRRYASSLNSNSVGVWVMGAALHARIGVGRRRRLRRLSPLRRRAPSRWAASAVGVRRSAEPTAPGRLDDEYVTDIHLDLAGRAVLFARAVGALDPVAPDRPGRAAGDAEGRDAPVIREHHRGHRLEKTHA